MEPRNREIAGKIHETDRLVLKALELAQEGDLSLARAAISQAIERAKEVLSDIDEKCMLASEILKGLG